MESDKLNQAVQLIKAGNKQAALPLLKQIVQSEPNNEEAWLWLSSCLDDISQKKYCLQKASGINPNNMHTRSALEKLSFVDTPILQNKTNSSQEITYYKEDPVLVTSHRIVFGGETHVLRNITSVSGVKLPPNRSLGITITVIAIFLCLCMNLMSFLMTKDSHIPMYIGIFSVLTFIAGIIIIIMAKPRYIVKLVSGSGIINGFLSQDKQEVANIVNAINKAIIEKS